MSSLGDPGPITMYGADWCADCRRAKAWFADRGIDYTYVDLIAQPDQTEVVLARNEGRKSIPVIVFADDTHLTEPSNVDLEAKVAALVGNGSPATVIDNTEASRFELRRGADLLSFADYRSRDGAIVVPHVETDPAFRGQGNAARLMDGLLEIIRADGRTIVPLCPFAAAHIRDDPEHQDLLAPR